MRHLPHGIRAARRAAATPGSARSRGEQGRVKEPDVTGTEETTP